MVHYSLFSTTEERFISYAKIDTQADPLSNTSPSSEKQKNLSKLLFQQFTESGFECELTEHGYVYAFLKSISSKNNIPALCFCAHIDTAPDCSGTNVKPIVHRNYQLNDIVLPDDASIVISPKEFAALQNKKGHDIITASGLTLLGSDDKSGVTAILEAALFMKQHSEILHGDLCFLLTTDEEIGHGVDHVDVKKIGAQYAYTMDSGDIGSYEDETFSADGCTVTIQGVSTHPGYAKGKMENAIKIASEIIALLPKDVLSPESTSGSQGFVHPTRLNAVLESATIDFIIRDFDTIKLKDHLELIRSCCEKVIKNYPNSSYSIKNYEQYRNMKEVIQHHPKVVQYLVEGMKEMGIEPKHDKIRGGTDGSRLSFMGLPCPNIFAGEQAIHSKKEWVSVQDMQKAAELIVRICQIWERNSN